MIEKYALKDIHKRSILLIALPKIFYFVPVFLFEVLNTWPQNRPTHVIKPHKINNGTLCLSLSHTYSLFKGQFTTYIISDDVRQIGWVNKWQGTNQLSSLFYSWMSISIIFQLQQTIDDVVVTLSNRANSFYINGFI